MSKINIEKLLNASCEFKDNNPFIEQAAPELVEAVWKGIDFEGMSPKRRMNVYNEYGSKIKTAAYCNTVSEWFTNICSHDGGMGVKSLPKESNKKVVEIIQELKERKLQNEFLDYIIMNYKTLIAEFKAKKDMKGDESQCLLM